MKGTNFVLVLATMLHSFDDVRQVASSILSKYFSDKTLPIAQQLILDEDDDEQRKDGLKNCI